MHDWIIILRSGHAFALAFCAYAAGVIAAATVLAWPIVCVAVVLLALATLMTARDSWRRALRELTIICACFCVFGALFGAKAEADRMHPPFGPIDEHHIVAQAISLERPRPATSGVSVRVRIALVEAPQSPAAQSLEGRVALLEMPAARSDAQIAGHVVVVRGRVTIPGGPRNDGEPAERDQLAEQGVTVLLSAPALRDVVVEGPAPGIEAWLARLREQFAAAVEAYLPPLEATVLEGVLWGDRGNLPAELRQEFSDTGTVHVLTTAGLHLGILIGFVVVVLDIAGGC